MGWKGPYINVGDTKDDFLTDAFNRPYDGAATGQVRSAGPDGDLGTTTTSSIRPMSRASAGG